MFQVVKSADFRRIFALPRRAEIQDLSEELTTALKTPKGTMKLRPIQAAMLQEAYEQRGLLAPVGVGHGKTLVTLLLPVLLGAEKPVLFIPAQLREQTMLQVIPELSRHWQLHDNLRILSYSELSTVKGAKLLEDIEPDLVIADECHHIKRKAAARTRRFLAYFRKHKKTLFCGLSGTVTKDSLLNYWHLATLALKEKSPLPLSYTDIIDWDDALQDNKNDPYKRYVAPGALKEFCVPGECIRSGFRRRLVETKGVVATEESALGTSLIISERKVDVPVVVLKALDVLRKRWVTPSGEEIEDATAYARHIKELACGFYYEWVWPGDIPNYKWLKARAAWHAFIRDKLNRRFEGIDSPLQVVNACLAGRWEAEEFVTWQQIKQEYIPETRAVWMSDYLIDDIAHWLENECGIAWISHDAVGMRLRARNIKYYGGGSASSKNILTSNGPIAASIQAHGTGKNLQKWSKNLIVACPSSGLIWEQLLGRTHRFGQSADEVHVTWYNHIAELQTAFDKATIESRYIEETTGQKQKLLFARVVEERIKTNAARRKDGHNE